MRRSTRVRAGQLIVAELALAAVVASVWAPLWVLIGVATLAVAALIATFGRAGGRWWFEAVASQRRFKLRRRLAAAHVVAAAVGGRPGPATLPWLRTLAPTLTLHPVTVGSVTVGVGSDQDGWFAAVEVGSLWDDDPIVDGPEIDPWAPGAVNARPCGPVPYVELAALVEAGPDRTAVSCAQVVITPGPTVGQPRPAWVAVRMTPADALAAEQSGGLAAVERTVASAALRAARTLDGHGWPARVLDADGLLAALVEATGLDGPPQEHWSVWRSGRLIRTHYDITGWTPGHGTLALGTTLLAVSFLRRGEPGVMAVVAAQPGALARVCREVTQEAQAAGLRLRRVDGEHALAAYAAAPTAVAVAGLGLRRPKERERDRLSPTLAG